MEHIKLTIEQQQHMRGSEDHVEFKKGDEITIMENRVWYNGSMMQPYFSELLMDLVEYESDKGWDCLCEVPIPYNNV